MEATVAGAEQELRELLTVRRQLTGDQYHTALRLLEALYDNSRNPVQCSACAERGIRDISLGDFGLCRVHLKLAIEAVRKEREKQFCPFCALNFEFIPAERFGMCQRHFRRSQQMLW